nr:PIG-L family deacetylase [Flexivirga meconopsidis]
MSEANYLLCGAHAMLLTCAFLAWPWMARRLRLPRSTWVLLLTLTGVAAAANIACALLLNRQGHWLGAVVVGLSCLAVGVWPGLVLRRMIPTGAVSAERRVLAVGAHPDDLELACGATLAKLVDTGHEVHGLVMSHGQRGGHGEVRGTEARRGADAIGMRSIEVLDLPDTQLAETGDAMVRAIEDAVRRYNPDMILTHSANDHHQDHSAVHLATLRAARRHSSILCYESPSATRNFDPSVFVDVTDHLPSKLHAVRQHRDQAGKPYMTGDRLTSVAAFRGAQARRPLAEGFEVVRFVGLDGEEIR